MGEPNKEDLLRLGELRELIEGTSQQIGRTNQFYWTALGSMIPITAFLSTTEIHKSVYAGLLLLCAALALHWLSLNTKLNLDRLCWVRMRREVEGRAYRSLEGPYLRQESFFEKPAQDITRIDRILVHQIRTTRFKYITICLLFVALAVVVYAAFSGNALRA